MGTEWIDKLLVKDLREELKKRNLVSTGLKADLQQRLTEAVKSEIDEQENAKVEEAEKEEEVAEQASPSEVKEDEAEEKKEETPTVIQEIPGLNTEEESVVERHSDPTKSKETILAETGGEISQKDSNIDVKPPKLSRQEEKAEAPSVSKEEVIQGVGGGDISASPEGALETSAAEIAESAANEQKHKKDSQTPNPTLTSQALPGVAQQSQLPTQNVSTSAKEELRSILDTPKDVEEAKKIPPMEPVKEKLPAMAAALLNTKESIPKLAPQSEEGEEELVDFETDEVMEDPPKVDTPAEKSAIVEAPISTTQRYTDASIPISSSKRPRESEESSKADTKIPSGEAKRQREPIPIFKPLDRRSSRQSDIQPRRSSTPGLGERKSSVFERIASLGGETPKGPGAPPSRIKATKALLVTGFVRPFTLMQAQALFKAYGEVDTFWMPNIRDKAYVIFESEESAEAARQAVHGLEWPQGNRTSLRPKFINEEEAKTAIEGSGKPLVSKGRGLVKQESAQNMVVAANADATRFPLEKRKSDQTTGPLNEAKKPKVEEQEKGVTLEDLFRKTETLPHLYWLPYKKGQVPAEDKKATTAVGEKQR